MVRHDVEHQRVVVRRRLQDFAPAAGVAGDEISLHVGQRLALPHHFLVHGAHAHVVQHRAQAQGVQLALVQAVPGAERD
jgi:hypothetical protein